MHIFNCVHVILQLHWYRDKYIYIIYQNIIFHLQVHIFLLILKEINAFSWIANSLRALGIMHAVTTAWVFSVVTACSGTSLPRIGTELTHRQRRAFFSSGATTVTIHEAVHAATQELLGLAPEWQLRSGGTRLTKREGWGQESPGLKLSCPRGVAFSDPAPDMILAFLQGTCQLHKSHCAQRSLEPWLSVQYL